MNTDKLRLILDGRTYRWRDTSELLEIADQLDAHQAEHEDIVLQLSILSGHIIPDRCMDDAPEEREDTPLHELAGIDEPVEDSKWEMDEVGNEPQEIASSETWARYYSSQYDVNIIDPDGWARKDGRSELSWNEKITKEEFERRLAASTCSYGPKSKAWLDKRVVPAQHDEEPEYVEDFKWEMDEAGNEPTAEQQKPWECSQCGHAERIQNEGRWFCNWCGLRVRPDEEPATITPDEICQDIRELLAPLVEATPSLKGNCARIYERVAELEAERDAALRPVSDHPRCGVHGLPQPCSMCSLREAEVEIARLQNKDPEQSTNFHEALADAALAEIARLKAENEKYRSGMQENCKLRAEIAHPEGLMRLDAERCRRLEEELKQAKTEIDRQRKRVNDNHFLYVDQFDAQQVEVLKAEAERDALALSLQQQEEETTKALAERDAAQAQVAALVAAAVDRSYANSDTGHTFSECRICRRGWSGTADSHADDCPIRALTNPKEGEDTDIEALAIYAHAAWSGWMAHMFSKCSAGSAAGTIVIPADFAERWQRQAATAYADLPETEKESDRDEARRMLAIIRANLKGGGDAVL